MNIWLNLVAYQLTWLAAVAGAGMGLWWSGPLAALAFTVLVFALGGRAHSDLILVAVTLGVGLVFDSALLAAGWVVFNEPNPLAFLPPGWMMSCWVAFALTLNHCMRSLQRLPLVSGLLGLLGAPLAYWAAVEAWSALSVTIDILLFLGVIGVVWAVLAPALLEAARRLAPVADTEPAASVTRLLVTDGGSAHVR